MTVPEFLARFPDDAAAESWFVEMRWPDGPAFKRGYVDTYHHVSVTHTGRYLDEFVGRHNIRPLDINRQTASVSAGMVGKSLPNRRFVNA